MSTETSIMATEEKKLKDTLETVEEEIKNSEERLESLAKNNGRGGDDSYVIAGLMKMFAKRLRELEKAKDKPYFARVDFKEKTQDESQILYIGKTNVTKGTENVVIDWRAPISSIYYDGRLGNVKYTAPDGVIEGELLLKRLFEITKGNLESFSDIDITSNDELLKPYLSSNSNTRLKNIISTIQAEQNKIIRAPLNKPIIVQGVAGSGKTTVALHRIAYLAYNYEKSIKPNEFMILAPNKFFLDYISAILPDLGVEDVNQLTFEEFAQQVIGEKLKIENSNNVLANIVNEGRTDIEDDEIHEISKFKSSYEFKEMLDKYLSNIEERFLPVGDISLGDFTILSHERLLENFKSCSIREKSLEEKLKIFKYKLSFFFEENEEKICDAIREKRAKEIEKLDKTLPKEEYQAEKIKIYDKYDPYLELAKNKGKKIVTDYLKQIKKKSALDYYKDFISKLDCYLDENSEINEELIRKIQGKLLDSKNKKQVEYEDLTPLMYIAEKIRETTKEIVENNGTPKHIIIDEAQDYSTFQFYVLKKILKSNSMTILGDVAQGIYSYRGTKNWDDVKEKVFDNDAEILKLSKSYRTTVEIMDKGNDVIESIKDRINVDYAEPVIRRGIPVSIEKKENDKQTVEDIISRLEELTQTDNKNIAVITKTLQEATELAKKINKKGIPVHLLSDKETKYKGGVSIVPSYLSKGLEFDSVIITNASQDEYGVNELDAKLLYVAITRAMHTLDVFYTGEKSKLLEPRTFEEKTVTKGTDENKKELEDVIEL